MLTVVFGAAAICGVAFGVATGILYEREKDKAEALFEQNQILASAAQEFKKKNFCLFADNMRMRKEMDEKAQRQFDDAVGNLKSEKKYSRGA